MASRRKNTALLLALLVSFPVFYQPWHIVHHQAIRSAQLANFQDPPANHHAANIVKDHDHPGPCWVCRFEFAQFDVNASQEAVIPEPDLNGPEPVIFTTHILTFPGLNVLLRAPPCLS